MRRASGQRRRSHGLTLKRGQRRFNLPTTRRSCCSTSPSSKVDLLERVSLALSSTRLHVPVRREVREHGRGQTTRPSLISEARQAHSTSRDERSPKHGSATRDTRSFSVIATHRNWGQQREAVHYRP